MERSANESLVLVEPGNFDLGDWMEILTALIAIVGLVGNSVVLLVLWLLGFRIPRNPFSIYILNLAGADTLFLCGQFALSIHGFLEYLRLSVMGLLYVTSTSYTAGLSLLAAISTQRCVAVLFPIWYRCHHTKHTSAAVCAVLWALASLLWLSLFFFCTSWYNSHLCYAVPRVLVVWFFLLTCVLCVSSLTLLLRVQCSSQRRQPSRLYLLVLLTVLVFLLCGLAPGIEIIMLLFDVMFKPLWLPMILACVNSSANPFIYFFLGSQRHKRRREPLRVVLQRAMADDQESEGESRETPHTSTLETSP
ncbi:mas-related G-protein coupled receptor member X1-like [Vombatus ursinus]|uniref:mas-related G-protein coupled receptor member X1-like n=1 Tax=Vombatus ursinus TaxID=29139 RepID=UPI000FFD1A54|nr:mas-related G-protein coupled receptor member X1-like [Vombatus ursinus]